MDKTLNSNVSNRYFLGHYTRREYLTQIIKNKNLPFVITKKPECTEFTYQNSYTQFAHEK